MNIWYDIKHWYQGQHDPIKKLIVLNVAVFALEKLLGLLFWLFTGSSAWVGAVVHWFMVPLQWQEFFMRPWAVLTYAFLHGDVWHILMNMLILFWFGQIFTEYNKKERTWFYYLAGAIGGALLAMLSYSFIPVIHQGVGAPYMLGASASVMCIVVAITTLVPNYSVFVFLLGPVKLKYIAVFYVFIDLISIPAGNPAGHISHIGGALTGFFLVKQLQAGTDWAYFFKDKLDKFAGFFSRKNRMTVIHNKSSNKREAGTKPTQEQIDAILDKITQSGYASLSDKEKEILFKASKND